MSFVNIIPLLITVVFHFLLHRKIGEEILILYFVCFFLNLVLLKGFRRITVFRPAIVILFGLIQFAWHYLSGMCVIYITDFPPVYQTLLGVSLFGLLVLQLWFQKNLANACILPISEVVPLKTKKTNLESSIESNNILNVASLSSEPARCCPTCGNRINLHIITTLSEENPIFCGQCGEKIRYQEVFQLSKEKILADHQEILRQVQQSTSKPNSSDVN
jgi:hypothetical protein